MAFNPRFMADDRIWLRNALLGGAMLGFFFFLLSQCAGPRDRQLNPEKVWKHVVKVAAERDIEPGFIYSIAWAESSLIPSAKSSAGARGVMQLKKVAWKEATDRSYREVWNWKANIEAGADYLAFCKRFLESDNAFSYPLLAACYHYGPYYVKQQGYDLSTIKPSNNRIYRELFAGNIAPVKPPTH